MQGGLQEPFIVFNLIPAQILLHFGDVPLQAELGHCLLALVLGPVLPAGALLLQKGLRQLPDVVPVVPVLGEGRGVLSQYQLHVSGLNGDGEFMNLISGVVDVKFPPDLVTGPLQHTGQGVSKHASPGVADVHGPGGVGGDELPHDLLPPALGHRAVLLPLGLDIGQHLTIPLAAQGEVQKPRPGNLHLVKEGAGQLQMVRQNLGDGPGGHMEGLGAGHSEGGSVVPVGGILGNLHGGLDLGPGGQEALSGGGRIRGLGEAVDLLLGRLDQIGHDESPFLSSMARLPQDWGRAGFFRT